MLAHGDRDKQAYKDAVAVLALERACVCIGTTAAAREIINVYTYFGDLFRIDVQRQLSRMGERSLPALIEAKYHDSRMVRTWAERRLDSLGKVIPSESRAHGRQSGAGRRAPSLRPRPRSGSGTCHRQLRQQRPPSGARGCPRVHRHDRRARALAIARGLREPHRQEARQQLGLEARRHRTIRNLRTAPASPRSTNWPTTASPASKRGKLDDAIAAFDKVLARAPTFERRAEMVPAYVDYAKALHDKNRAAARAALRRAELLDPSGPLAKSIQSEQLLIEAEELRAQGMLDLTLLRRAVELDPSNVRAKGELEKAELDLEVRQNSWRRYAAAVAIGLIAMER